MRPNILEAGPQFPPASKLRSFAYGLPGAGKTSLASSIPKSLHIDMEAEGGFCLHAHAKRVAPVSGQEFEDVLDWLRNDGPIRTGFTTISIDTIDSALLLLYEHLANRINAKKKTTGTRQIEPITDIREYGTKGAGYLKLTDFFTKHLTLLSKAGYGWLVTGHARDEEFDDPTRPGAVRRVLRPTIYPTLRGGLLQITQYCGVLKYRKARSNEPNPGSRTYKWDFTTTESSVNMGAIAKARLISQMTVDSKIEIDVTGPDGYGKFAERYTSACKLAKQSLTPAGSPPSEEKSHE